jgi:hypothetical protein
VKDLIANYGSKDGTSTSGLERTPPWSPPRLGSSVSTSNPSLVMSTPSLVTSTPSIPLKRRRSVSSFYPHETLDESSDG